ncbi:glutamine-dependent NAD(+) synthetase [Scenedesmus sp. PABB004]|nr:glutamine-dependent NAD(+) synthetase [Scenedesmus sp. PABB004]
MRRRLATLATCNLNQWAMDFSGNLERIQRSIADARAAGATYRVGPELEVCGYGCEDHFYELDTVNHAWEVLAELVRSGATAGLLVDVGMPVIHRGVLYNCRCLLLDGKVLLLRPKLHLANDGNYRRRGERSQPAARAPRAHYFAAWKHKGVLEPHRLPPDVSTACGGQADAPFGDGVLALDDAVLAAETCEELFTPAAPHIGLALAGVEVISNGSGSHHQLRKLHTRLDLITSATAKAGGVYLYANQQGCDGGRLYYDGCACVAINGALVAQGSQFSLADVEVTHAAAPRGRGGRACPPARAAAHDTPPPPARARARPPQVVTATVDLDEVVSFRAAISSLREQASATTPPALVAVPFQLCRATGPVDPPRAPRFHVPEEEIALGPAAWLWDYLRRSDAAGFLLPLSGGADSSSVAAIVGSMCQLVVKAAAAGDAAVAADARRVGQYGEGEALGDAGELAGRLLHTVYMGTANSSADTRARAKALAGQVGSYHLDVSIDSLVAAVTALFTALTGAAPRFRVDGGSPAENLALQNIQARLRMVFAFLLAQLLPWARRRGGFLLVLGAANVDEALRGYLTKYDCSAADINPIGGVSKADLRSFLAWPRRRSATPRSPTCAPRRRARSWSRSGRARGPVAMFRAAAALWRDTHPPLVVADKVKAFFRFYAINRHKATVLPPAYHAEGYSPDDNRFDHRQFLYNTAWTWQFARVDDEAAAASGGGGGGGSSGAR